MTHRADMIATDTQFIVDEALQHIALIHDLPSVSVAARDLHATVTLARAARSRMPRLVADARDEQVTWAEIGRILGTGRLRAALRYAPIVRRKRSPLALD